MSAATTDDRLAPYSPRALRAWPGSIPGHVTVDGTLLFADVSGFTRLTERLARQGKVGAEETVTIISDVWQALLARDDGGDVLKFAGDALLILYQGTGHASRAAQRALAMQKELSRIGRIERGGTVVRLRMSIGISSGPISLFAVGADHVDLLVLGQTASRTLEMEATASAGQVLVSDATAELLEDARLGKRVGHGTLLRAVPPCPPLPQRRPEAEHPPARFVPPSLRDRLGRIEHEHRWAAVGFGQLGGLDRLLAERGNAETFALVHGFTTHLMETLDSYGALLASCDVVKDGAGFMITAGVPDANGDDAVRMLRVARSMVEAYPDLAVRVGVNAGNVFTGEVGPPFRRAFVAMGDVTNLAARMMSRAPWGEVLATRFALEPVHGFVTRRLEPFPVKGKRRPVEASLVVGVEESAPTRSNHVGPLVGRERELETMVAAVADVRTGSGRILELVGEQGTGKSRLVAELRQMVSDLRWITVTSDRFERTSAYHTARAVLRQMLSIPLEADPAEAGARLGAVVDHAAPHLRPWVPLMAVAVGASVHSTPESEEVADRFRRIRTQQVIAELLEASVDQPLGLVLEDAADMDDASAELMAALLSGIDTQTWLVVVTRTTETTGLHEGRGYKATVLQLEPLPETSATLLAERLAETTPVPRHLIPEMVARSAGNPFFLSELLAGVEGDAMPHTVEGIIAARIDRLSPLDRQTLRYLSVLGESFNTTTLEATVAELGVSISDEALWARLEAFVTRQGDRFRFVNPLIRQVAYEGLTFERRRALHGRVADLLRRRRSDGIALHLLRAERWEGAWQAAREAAERAQREGANVIAAELYDMALESAGHLDLPPRELTKAAASAGACWARVGVPERALDAYGVALSAAEDQVTRLLLAARRAEVHENAGRFRQALGLYARAMKEAEGIDDESARQRLLGVLGAGYASTRHRQGRLDEAIETAKTAVAHAEAAGDRETLAYLFHLLDRALTAVGSRKEALAYRDAALPIFAELGDLAAQGTVLHDLAADAQRGGRLEEATWLFERAIDARVRAGDVVRAAASVNALGEVELSLGMAEAARNRFAEALRTWRGARSPEGIVVAATNLAAADLDLGDADGAIRHVEEAEHRAHDIGAEHLLAPALLLRAGAYVELGRWVEAWEAASDALIHATEDSQRSRAHALRAETLAATGGKERAEQERAAADNLDEGS